jgi:hypothetical protein
VDKLKGRLWDMEKERLYLQCKVEEVQAYLTALGAEERFVVEQFCFEKLTWRMVAERYRREFGNYISRDTLRKKKKAAIRQMGSIEKSPV